MDKLGVIFTFRGRLNRASYWQGGILIWMGIVVLGFLISSFVSVLPTLALVALSLFSITFVGAAALAGLSLVVRRLHDRGKSAWWLFPMWLPLLLLSALAAVMAVSEPDGANFVRLLGLPFSLWIFVELGCLRGTVGPNKYGDDPLQPLGAAEVFG